MDKKRRRMIKLIVVEMVMVILIVIMLVVFVLLAMGYQINPEGKLEQNGLLQMISVPTGATMEIDGQRLAAKTNVNKMLTDGMHKIKLERTGYGAWEKTVKMRAGIFTQLTARLWPTTLEFAAVRTLPEVPMVFAVLPGRERILLAQAMEPTRWRLINSSNPKPEGDEAIDMSAVMKHYLEKDGKIGKREVCKLGKIWLTDCEKEVRSAVAVEQIEWTKRGRQMLLTLQTVAADGVEGRDWWLVELRAPEKAVKVGGVINGVEYERCKKEKSVAVKAQCQKNWRKEWQELEFLNEESDEKLVGRTDEGEIVEVVVREGEAKYSTVAEQASAMTVADNNIIYTKNGEEGVKLWVYADANAEMTGLRERNLCLKAWRFADRNYLAVVKNNRQLEVYRDAWPVREKEEWRGEKIAEYTMASEEGEEGCRVELKERGGVMWAKFMKGENVFFNSKEEGLTASRWRFEEFLADEVMMRAEKGWLVVQESDGANRRELAPVSAALGVKGVALTADDRFLLVMMEEGGKMVMKRAKVVN